MMMIEQRANRQILAVQEDQNRIKKLENREQFTGIKIALKWGKIVFLKRYFQL
jgi:hypothetical protein